MKKMESFPPELVDELLILLLQPNNYTSNFSNCKIFVRKIGEYQEKSKYTCSGPVVDAMAKQISSSHRGKFLDFRSHFENILTKSKSLGSAEETPSLCGLLDSLAQDELSFPLARFLLSHCCMHNDKVIEFLRTQSEASTLDPAIFELVLLLPIERRTIAIIHTLKTHPEFANKFIEGLANIPSDLSKEFFNSFFLSPVKDPTFLRQIGIPIVSSSSEEVVRSFSTHLIGEKSWLKPEYFTDLVSLISNAAKSHSSETYRPLICALLDPPLLYSAEALPAFPTLVEAIKRFYLLRPDKISSDIAQAYVKLINSVQEKDRPVFLSVLPELIDISGDESKEILGKLPLEI